MENLIYCEPCLKIICLKNYTVLYDFLSLMFALVRACKRGLESVFCRRAWGVMGIGMGYAIGASVTSGSPVVAIEGDSAFGFSG